MKSQYSRVGILFLVLMCMIAVNACTKKNVPIQPFSELGSGAGSGSGLGAGGSGMGGIGSAGLDDARWRDLGLNTEGERKEFSERAKNFENADIYFDFNGYVLSSPAKKILDEKIDFLKRYPKVRVTIEGNCDERGTSEYNLALGERRAHAAFEYFLNSGVGQQRMNTVSYGSERPVASGHDEASWAKNRRDHFTLNY